MCHYDTSKRAKLCQIFSFLEFSNAIVSALEKNNFYNVFSLKELENLDSLFFYTNFSIRKIIKFINKKSARYFIVQ